MRTLQIMIGTARELFSMLWARKLWWLVPAILVLLAFGVLIMMANSAVTAPFIYSLF